MKFTMRKELRRGSLAIAASAALLGTTAVSAQAAKEPSVPLDCWVQTKAINPAGVDNWYRYANGIGSVESPHLSTGMVPLTYQNYGHLGGDGASRSNGYAVATNGYLWDFQWEVQLQPDGTRPLVFSKKVLATNWGGIRHIAYAKPTQFMYGLTSSGLNRYKAVRAGDVPTSAVSVGGAGWGNIGNLSYSRTVVIGKTATGADRKADQLLGTVNSDGDLVEYTIPHDKPTAWTRVLRKGPGWGDFASLSQGSCSQHPNARVLLGIKKNGLAFAYFDPNKNDNSLADLRGGNVAVATGWTNKSYSQ